MKHHKRLDIEGLRAISVLAVVFFHAGVQQIGGGFVGVDVFFVISGFLIGRQIYEQLAQRPKFWSFLGWFYERRARRILPAFFFVSGLTAIAAYWLFLPDRFEDFAKALLYSSFLSANIYFLEVADYFGPQAHSQPLLHYWSLAVEEHFYIVFPILMFVLWKFGQKAILAVLLVILVATLAASQVMLTTQPDAVFYMIWYRAWELLIGAVLAMAFVAAPRHDWMASLATAIGLIAIGYAILFTPVSPFPGFAALPPCVGAALVIWGGMQPNPVGRVLGCSPMAYVGALSYSLYLTHWPVIVFANRFPALDDYRLPVVLIISFLLAMVSFHLIETPTRRRSGIWTVPKVASLSASGLIAMLLVAVVIIRNHGLPERLPADVQAVLSYRFDRTEAYREHTCFLHATQTFDDIDKAKCLPSARPLVLLWGDSFAAHYVPGLSEGLAARGYTLAQLTSGQCLPIVGRTVPTRPTCKQFNSDAFDWARQNLPQVIILSGHWAAGLADIELLKTQISTLAGLGIKVVVFGQGPFYRDAVPTLIADRWLANNRAPLTSANLERNILPAVNAMRVAFKGFPDATFVDIFDTVCLDLVCPTIDGEVPYYMDQGHLTPPGSKVFAQKLLAASGL